MSRLWAWIVALWHVDGDDLVGYTVSPERFRKALEEASERQMWGVPYHLEVRRRSKLFAPAVRNPGDWHSRYMRTVSEREAVWR